MGSQQEQRPREHQPSPFDSQPGTPTAMPLLAAGTAVIASPGPTAAGSPAGAAPFMGMYDVKVAPQAGNQPGGPTTGSSDPNITLFTGITAEQTDAKEIASQLNGNAGYYAGYDGANTGTTNPAGKFEDHAYDVAAVLAYSQIGNQVDINPILDKNGNPVRDKNGNIKYDIDQSFLSNININLGKENYLSAQDLGEQGANAVLSPEDGHVPAKAEPITIDAHSGGGQTAFFTALELYKKGYTDVNIVGFDMAMTPAERATLEKLGVDVSNTTTHINVAGQEVISPMASLIQWGMGGSNTNFYDNSIKLGYGDVFTSTNPETVIQNWHEFHHNDVTMEYMNQQNGMPTSGAKPTHLVDPRVQTAAALDTKNGTASGSLSLAGTTLNLPGGPKVVGDWAQLSGGVDLKQKAANVNVGGAKGLGADINLSQGQIDLNLFGKHVDVDQAYHTAAKNVTSGIDYVKKQAQTTGQGVSKWAQDSAESASNWVQNSTQAAKSWVGDTTQSAGNWLQGATQAAKSWLFGGEKQGSSASATKAARPATPAGTATGKSSAALGDAKAGAFAKPAAGKSATGAGTVVTAPSPSPALTPGKSGSSKSTAPAKAADDIAQKTSPKSAAPVASAAKPATDAAPKNSSNSKPAKSSPKATDDGGQKSKPDTKSSTNKDRRRFA